MLRHKLPAKFFLVDEDFRDLLTNGDYKPVLIEKQKQSFFGTGLLLLGVICILSFFSIAFLASNYNSLNFFTIFFVFLLIAVLASPAIALFLFLARPHTKAIENSRLLVGRIIKTNWYQVKNTYGFSVDYRFTTEAGETIEGSKNKEVLWEDYKRIHLPHTGIPIIVVYDDSHYNTIL